jgi:hypothetical protein
MIDTLELARRLESAGFEHRQAGDMAAAIAAAYRDDLQEVRTELHTVSGKLTVMMWAIGINAAATVAIFGMLFQLAGRLPVVH